MRCGVPVERPVGAKQRAVRVGRDARRRDVLIKVRFQLRYAGRFMFLAALLVQAHPSAPPLAEVVAHVHLQHRADAGKGVNHHADQRPIAQARERAGINRRQQRTASSRSSTGVLPFFCEYFWRARHAPGSPRVHSRLPASQTACAAPPSAVSPWAWKALPFRQTQHFDIGGDVGRFHRTQVDQSSALAPVGKPAGGLVIGPPRVAVADMRREEAEEPLRGFFMGEKKRRGVLPPGPRANAALGEG
jgi:hypothetical protein